MPSFTTLSLSPFALCTGLPAHWQQGYDPTHHWWLSTLFAALPLVALLVALLGFRLCALDKRTATLQTRSTPSNI
jgi:hypothetical protein